MFFNWRLVGGLWQKQVYYENGTVMRLRSEVFRCHKDLSKAQLYGYVNAEDKVVQGIV
jgi:hypothetical protein